MGPKFFQVILEETRSIKDLKVLSLAFRRLWAKGSKLGIVLAVVFSVIEALLYTVNPMVLRHLIDTLNAGYNFGWNSPLPHAIPFLNVATCYEAITWLTVVMIVASILWYGAFNLSTGFARNATYYSQVTFGTEAFSHILKLSMDFHVKSRKGEVLTKTDQAIQQSQDFLYNSFFGNFLRAGLSIVLVLGVLYSIDWRLFTICAIALFLGVYTNFVFGSRVSREEKQAWRNVTDVNARSLDVLQNIEEIKIFGNEEFEANRRQEEAEKQLAPLKQVTMLWRKLTTLENLAQNTGFALAMFWIVLPGVVNHKLTVGQVAQFISYYLMLFSYFMELLFRYLNAQRLVPKLRDVKDLLALKPSVDNAPGAEPYPGLAQGFMFEHVTFVYDQAKRASAQKIDLFIPKSKITVIAGKTGSGKSTLINLLTRLYDPTSGSVLSDGVNIQSFDLRSYRRSFAILSQKAYLFNASIAYNISYSRLDSSREEIEKAARIAQIHDFIQALPDGYETVISERAANISGGEKQRIALARAVLARDSDTVILDEPTTGLDTLTARSFLNELIRVFHGKTIIIITHDPSIMSRADQIVFMENGQVVQTGSHDTLTSECLSYRELVSI